MFNLIQRDNALAMARRNPKFHIGQSISFRNFRGTKSSIRTHSRKRKQKEQNTTKYTEQLIKSDQRLRIKNHTNLERNKLNQMNILGFSVNKRKGAICSELKLANYLNYRRKEDKTHEGNGFLIKKIIEQNVVKYSKQPIE